MSMNISPDNGVRMLTVGEIDSVAGGMIDWTKVEVAPDVGSCTNPNHLLDNPWLHWGSPERGGR